MGINLSSTDDFISTVYIITKSTFHAISLICSVLYVNRQETRSLSSSIYATTSLRCKKHSFLLKQTDKTRRHEDDFVQHYWYVVDIALSVLLEVWLSGLLEVKFPMIVGPALAQSSLHDHLILQSIRWLTHHVVTLLYLASCGTVSCLNFQVAC